MKVAAFMSTSTPRVLSLPPARDADGGPSIAGRAPERINTVELVGEDGNTAFFTQQGH